MISGVLLTLAAQARGEDGYVHDVFGQEAADVASGDGGAAASRS